MKINRCISCENETPSYPCPHCGFDAAAYQQPADALPCNTILLGRYLVGKVLGQGGFGITYVGWDLVLERKVAIKEYFPNGQVMRSTCGPELYWSASPRARELQKTGMDIFLREARKMAKVEDIPEVVHVKNTFVENQTAYIVMDFVEGETLKDRVKGSGPLSWKKAKAVFLPVMEAMEKVHEAGLIHRDLSPDNLMIQPNGDVKILDLGAAKDLTGNKGVSSVQVAKSGFSPIEQYTNQGLTGQWTDVYALTATLYYALTGAYLPAATDRMEAMVTGSGDPINWDLPELQKLPPQVIKAMKAALETPANKRTQSMGKLRAGLQGQGKQPNRISPWIWVGAAVVLTALLLSCIHIHSWQIATCESPSVCEKCGKTRGEAMGHSWQAADCEHPEICLICGETAGEALGHSWLDAACETAKTCTVCGKTEGEPLGHDWAQATVLTPKTCVRCGKTDGTVQPLAAKNQEIMGKAIVAAGRTHSVVLSDGRLLTAGKGPEGQLYVNNWDNLVAVAAGDKHTVGLKADGTVVAVGQNSEEQCDVQGWSDVVAIAAGDYSTIALCANGSVLATGWNTYGQCKVDQFRTLTAGKKIISIAAGYEHTVVLCDDGTVAAIGHNESGQCNVSSWENIVAIYAGTRHTVGLKADGTVVATGKNDEGQCNVSGWRDIVNVCAGDYHTVGVHADGTVVAVGRNTAGQCDLNGWNNIAAVGAGTGHTVGIRTDGTAVAEGREAERQCDVSSWINLRMP